ncbi:PQQ-dependent sugar dehydrogenase [Arthrobacter sp. MYb213]|uniref:PQQ-dependent sugar dehydrogenase n=1 Tax=Arthrobacter sp. MYb213 TaxID=1848595 RepID=UPI000CFC66A2|nr:PQQ-dependent sugar dehydrogenase [Arthrobacter sp. MYb213]PRB70161.1 glucose dehydrogenase [Arthrobacter sp. MYb213]
MRPGPVAIGNTSACLAIALACAVSITACTAQPATTPDALSSSATAPQAAEPRVVADELNAPWSMVFAETTLLVSERDSGRILEIDMEGNQWEVNKLDDVVHGGEGGLLGLAYQRPFLFAYSTAAEGNRIQRFEVTGEAGNLSLTNPQTLISGLPSATIHNGGRLAIGPDLMLYATVGDAGDESSAQDLDSLGGKILRLTTDGEVPEDNPFPDSPVFSFGHRNPQGLAWASDGTMYASEFGQNRWDELNLIRAGANYGWPVTEGIANNANYVDPLQQWSTESASPSGMSIHQDVLYLANLRGERLRIIDLSSPSDSTETFTGRYGRFRDVAVNAAGELWVLTNNTDGRGTAQESDDRILGIFPQSLVSDSVTDR